MSTSRSNENLGCDSHARAVSWVAEFLSPAVKAGVFSSRPSQGNRLYFEEIRLRAQLDIWHGSSDGTVPQILTERQAEALFEQCETNRAAYDILCHSAASYVWHRWEMPEVLKNFAVLCLGQQLAAPPYSKTDRAFARKFLLITAATFCSSAFGIKLTRNDESKRADNARSACDVVSEALDGLGHAISPRAIKDICVGTHKNERAFYEMCCELTESLCAYAERNRALPWLGGTFPKPPS